MKINILAIHSVTYQARLFQIPVAFDKCRTRRINSKNGA
jgi:hypothetical protein